MSGVEIGVGFESTQTPCRPSVAALFLNPFIKGCYRRFLFLGCYNGFLSRGAIKLAYLGYETEIQCFGFMVPGFEVSN